MAQETWGLKLDLDLKEKVQEIIKTDFDSSKEFMEQLVNMYELHQLKQGENILTQEVEELEALTRRINGIFINANAKINTMLLDKDQKLIDQTALKQQLIEKLQGDLFKLEQEKEAISAINDQLTTSNAAHHHEVHQLTQSNLMLTDLVDQYKEKNDTLTGLLQEYKEDRERNKALQKENHELALQIETLSSERAGHVQKILNMATKMEDLEDAHEIALTELEAKLEEEHNFNLRKTEINVNLRVLEINEAHQTKMQQIQSTYNKEIEEYQAKYKALLEQMEQQKAPKATSKASKKEKDTEKK